MAKLVIALYLLLVAFGAQGAVLSEFARKTLSTVRTFQTEVVTMQNEITEAKANFTQTASSLKANCNSTAETTIEKLYEEIDSFTESGTYTADELSSCLSSSVTLEELDLIKASSVDCINVAEEDIESKYDEYESEAADLLSDINEISNSLLSACSSDESESCMEEALSSLKSTYSDRVIQLSSDITYLVVASASRFESCVAGFNVTIETVESEIEESVANLKECVAELNTSST